MNFQTHSDAFCRLFKDYVAIKVLSTHPLQPTPKQQLLKWMFALLGMAWGLPWIWASMAVGTFFPAPVSTYLGIVFAIGIVVTVGADGWWIMREAGQCFEKKSAVEKAWQTLQQGKKQTRYLKNLAAFLFASCSCIAPVYASIRYTSGWAQGLSIITLVVYYGFGLVGYTQLIEQISVWWRDKRSASDLVNTRKKLADALEKLAAAPLDGLTVEKFMAYVEQSTVSPTFSPPSDRSKKRVIQKIAVCLIPPLSSIVSMFLINDFFYQHIWSNVTFTIILAIIAEISAFVITSLATFRVSGHLYDALLQKQKKKLNTSLLIAFLAPTAAGYITYTTLTAHHMPSSLIMIAVIAIGLARIVFSWFTLSHVLETLSTSTQIEALKQSRIRAFAHKVSQLDPAYFRFCSASTHRNV